MFKRIIIIFLVLAVFVTTSVMFDLHHKVVYKILPIFLRFRYGIITQAEKIEGGFKTGIIMHNVIMSSKTSTIECADVITDFRFTDFIFPRFMRYYNIEFNAPRILVKDFQSAGLISNFRLPLWLKTHIIISNAELSVKTKGQDFNAELSGSINVNRKNIEMHDWKILIGKLELQMNGRINRNKELNIEANFLNSENKFLICGSINKPVISTRWGGLETEFKLDGMKYDNGQLVLPKISGNVYPKGLPPVDISGELRIEKELMRFRNMVILGVVKADGTISRNRQVKLRLRMDDVDGSKFAEKLPQALRVFVFSHKVNADISVFGKMNNLQAGGTMKLMSTPIEITCRYGDHKFLFRTMGQGIFDMSGSVNLGKEQSLNIKCLFNKMDIKEFIAFLGRDVNTKCKGIITGELKITGDIELPLVESKLEIENAEIGSLKFDVAYLNLQGTGAGPFNLQHSIVYYKEIPAELRGYIDPKSKDILKNIEICPTSDSFVMEGINIAKDSQGNVVFGKNIGENINVRFKSLVTSDPGQDGEEKKPEIELEYKLEGDKNLTIKMQEEENTVGVNKKIEF